MARFDIWLVNAFSRIWAADRADFDEMKAFAGLPKRQFRDADAQAAAEAFWELPAGTLNGYVVEPLVGALERPGNPDITEVLIHDGQDRAFGLTLISPRKVAT